VIVPVVVSSPDADRQASGIVDNRTKLIIRLKQVIFSPFFIRLILIMLMFETLLIAFNID
jgi:hypothetical protein